MAEKTYKYTSICEREKAIQTNNPSTFIQHVASCATCKSKLPGSVIQALQPRLDQIIQQRKGGETSEEENATETKQPLESKGEEEPIPALDPLQEQFDTHMRESTVFRSMEKSVGETKTNLEKVTKKLDGIGDQISSQISSLGDRLVGKTTDEEDVGEEVDAGEATDEKKAPGEVLSDEEEKQQQGTTDQGWGKGDTRPNPFGAPDQIPASMREGYQPGQRKEETTREKVSPQGEKDPLDEEPPEKEIVQKGGGSKGTSDLNSPEELKAAKKWVAEQEEKMGGGKKTETEKKGEIPYASDLTDIIKAVREGIDAWKGTSGGGEAGEGVTFSKFAQELVLEMLKKQVATQAGVGVGAGGQVMTLEHMNTFANFLGTFFGGVKGLPKTEQEKMIKNIMESSTTASEAEETIH